MTADLRAALTATLRPLLPPHLVASTVDAAVDRASAYEIVGGAGAVPADVAMAAVLLALPSPYREAAEVMQAIAPIVSAWWRERVVEVTAGSVTVTEHR